MYDRHLAYYAYLLSKYLRIQQKRNRILHGPNYLHEQQCPYLTLKATDTEMHIYISNIFYFDIYSTYLSFDMTSLSPQQTDIDIFSPDPLPPLQDQISFISIWEL